MTSAWALTKRMALPALIGVVLHHAPALAQEGAADGPFAVDSTGFTHPSLENAELRGTRLVDASLAIEGAESTVEVFEKPDGHVIYRISLHGVTWAYGWLPGGDARAGYILRDRDCDGGFEEKWSPTAPFSAPECAVTAKPVEERPSE